MPIGRDAPCAAPRRRGRRAPGARAGSARLTIIRRACAASAPTAWASCAGCGASFTGSEAETPPPYSRDWAEASGRETMLDAAARHLTRNRAAARASGRRARVPSARRHRRQARGILTGHATMIHAMEGAPAAEVALSPWWRRRIAGAFAFPGTVLRGADGDACIGSRGCRRRRRGAARGREHSRRDDHRRRASARRSARSPARSIDQALLGGRARNVEGPRLSELHITASTEGAPIPRVYGRVRLGAQVIWATPVRGGGRHELERRQRQGLDGRRLADDAVPLFRQLRRRAVRGRDQRHRARLGGRARDRSLADHAPRLYRQRDARRPTA